MTKSHKQSWMRSGIGFVFSLGLLVSAVFLFADDPQQTTPSTAPILNVPPCIKSSATELEGVATDADDPITVDVDQDGTIHSDTSSSGGSNSFKIPLGPLSHGDVLTVTATDRFGNETEVEVEVKDDC